MNTRLAAVIFSPKAPVPVVTIFEDSISRTIIAFSLGLLK